MEFRLMKGTFHLGLEFAWFGNLVNKSKSVTDHSFSGYFGGALCCMDDDPQLAPSVEEGGNEFETVHVFQAQTHDSHNRGFDFLSIQNFGGCTE